MIFSEAAKVIAPNKSTLDQDREKLLCVSFWASWNGV